MNKRGQVIEIALVVIVAFVFILSNLIAGHVGLQIRSDLNNSNVLTNESKAILDEGVISQITTTDNLTLFIVGAIIVGIGVFSYLLPIHPAWVIVVIILSPLIMWLSGVISGVYVDVSTQTVLNTTAVHFANSNMVMTYLPWFTLGAIVSFCAGMFMKVSR
jgi:hypothetical protein